ncbi:TPRXL isoform X1 [Cucumis melo var. makuwa]|uniref:TPRXL isoform X1 n=1 Tax=Cucumis melo var. makuwa TaxID=1194695 RepID=A0A5A7VL86_CUCMM|nr:TPRXL isoform X1 [Cucumis melo var. makuwa]
MDHWFEETIANGNSNSVEFFRRGTNRPEDIMVEGLGSKQDSPITSKKRGRTEAPKEDVTVQKKQRIKSLVSKSRVYRRNLKKRNKKRLKERQESLSIEWDHILIVDDDELFDGYPWGRVAFELLVEFMNRASSAPEGCTYQSSAPEGCTYQSSAPEGHTYQSCAPEGRTSQSSAPEGRTSQSSAPEGCTYQSCAPEGCTYQSCAPEGCTYQSSAPEGCTYP